LFLKSSARQGKLKLYEIGKKNEDENRARQDKPHSFLAFPRVCRGRGFAARRSIVLLLLLKLINNSSSLNKENHNREGSFDTQSQLA